MDLDLIIKLLIIIFWSIIIGFYIGKNMGRKKKIAKIHEYERHINTQKQRIEVANNVINRYIKVIEDLKNELRNENKQ